MDFTDKRVLVTGGSRGIGFAIVRAFLDAGALVAVNGKTLQSVRASIDELGSGERLIGAPGDIGTVVGCELAVKTAVDAFAGLDILVNSAGIAASRSVADCDEAMWDAHVNVNLKGTFFCCRAAIPALRESKGNVVNIASDAGLTGFSGLTVYCASKGGVVNMTRAMALEIAPDVRVNSVCPGSVEVPFGVRELEGRAHRRHAGIGDENVAAAEAGQRLREAALDRGAFSHVHPDRDRGGTERGRRAGGCFCDCTFPG